MWIITRDNEGVNLPHIYWRKKDAISDFMKGTTMTWKELKINFGWRCIKVNISFEEVKK